MIKEYIKLNLLLFIYTIYRIIFFEKSRLKKRLESCTPLCIVPLSIVPSNESTPDIFDIFNSDELYWILVGLGVGIIIIVAMVSRHNYRSGHRVSSLDDINNSDGNDLLSKIWQQADIVGRQGFKYNIYSLWYIPAGCYLTPEDHLRILHAARMAEADGVLVNFGFKISPSNKICYVNGRGNTSIKSSSNLYLLVSTYGV